MKSLIINTSFGAIILTFLMKGIGFFREVILAHYYGVSFITDAYNIALSIPLTLFEYVTFALGVSFIPIFQSITTNKQLKDGCIFSNSLIILLSCYATMLIFIMQLFSEDVVMLFASGFNEETRCLSVDFTKIIAWNIYFLILNDIFAGYLQAIGKYGSNILASVPYNLCVIVFIILASSNNNILLAYGVLLASAIQASYMAIMALRNGYYFKTNISFNSGYIKEFFLLSLPTVAIAISEQVNTIVDKSLASGLLVGGVSMLSLSSRVIDMIRQVLVRPIGIVVFPKMCIVAEKKDMYEMAKIIRHSLKNILLLILPFTLIILIHSNNIIDFIFGHGAFSREDGDITASTLSMYSIGLIGYSCREILGRALFSMHDTITSTKNTVFCVGLNVILNIILSKLYGINGLALATAISGIISAIMLGRSVNKNVAKFIVITEDIKFIIIVFGSVCFMSFIIFLSNMLIIYKFGWIISILIGLIVYYFTLKIFNYSLISMLLF